MPMFLELVRGSAADQNLKPRATVTSSNVSWPLSSSHFIKASIGGLLACLITFGRDGESGFLRDLCEYKRLNGFSVGRKGHSHSSSRNHRCTSAARRRLCISF